MTSSRSYSILRQCLMCNEAINNCIDEKKVQVDAQDYFRCKLNDKNSINCFDIFGDQKF